jgi:DNA primase
MPASVIELSEGEDPDSFLAREGKVAFTDRVAKARPIFEYFVREVLNSHDKGSVAGKSAVLAEIIPRLKKIDDRMQRNLYVAEISRLLGIHENDLRREVGLSRLGKDAEPPTLVAKKSVADAEELLLALMGKYPEVALRVKDYGVERLFSPSFIPIAEAILHECSNTQDLNLARILEQVESVEERNRLSALFIDDSHLEEIDSRKAFEQCRLTRERSLLKGHNSKELIREMAGLDPDSERYMEILNILESLRNKKSQL